MFQPKNNKRLSKLKRGISPLIATVLLLGFVVAGASVAFIWGKNFVSQTAQKEGSISQAELTCQKVIISIEQTNEKFILTNMGSSNIDGLIIAKRDGGKTVTKCPQDEQDLQAHPQARYCPELPIISGTNREIHDDFISKIKDDTTEIVPVVLPKGAPWSKSVPCTDKSKTIQF